MKKFRFELAGLLRVREIEEERRQQALRQVQAELAALQREGEELTRQREEHRNGLACHAKGVLDLEVMRGHRRCLNGIERAQDELAVRRGQAQERLVEAAAELRRAINEREVVTRLRERRREEYLRALQRAETAELDESAHVRAARREEGVPS